MFLIMIFSYFFPFFILKMDMHGERQFFYGRVVAGEGEALIFVNYGSLAAFVEAQELHMDSTFYSPQRVQSIGHTSCNWI